MGAVAVRKLLQPETRDRVTGSRAQHLSQCYLLSLLSDRDQQRDVHDSNTTASMIAIMLEGSSPCKEFLRITDRENLRFAGLQAVALPEQNSPVLVVKNDVKKRT